VGLSEFGFTCRNRVENRMASKTNPVTFFKQVRSEALKITWPSRRETAISTAMVLVMVVFAALFFFAADQLIGWLIRLVLNVSV
jgi:preprotein translocase subunit SecE